MLMPEMYLKCSQRPLVCSCFSLQIGYQLFQPGPPGKDQKIHSTPRHPITTAVVDTRPRPGSPSIWIKGGLSRIQTVIQLVNTTRKEHHGKHVLSFCLKCSKTCYKSSNSWGTSKCRIMSDNYRNFFLGHFLMS